MMRRKLGQATFPNVYFKDNILSIPGYTFEKATPWLDTGGMTILAEGNSLKDGSNVLAKIAPAQSNASMCLEREAHILGKLTGTPDGNSTSLRMLDYQKIPPEHGECVVLLLAHPGVNLLGRYLPAHKVNDLLLVEPVRPRTLDVVMGENEEVMEVGGDMDGYDIMDLASFLEFAIQATRCIEVLHKVGIIHREVRGNAFHLNSHSGSVRFVHFGNRAISLESFGSPSSLVLQTYEESQKLKVKEALCYLAPEQTGSIETMTQDHRTDLYSLGILFWTLLVGRGQMPFEGGPLELLHAIVQKRPMPVHEVRRDIPQVLANIVDKLLAKNPDMRYQSAHGLKTDLLQCQSRLLETILSPGEQQHELIPLFDIALEDRFTEFTIPIALFGRDRELDTIRNVIRNASTSFSRHFMSATVQTQASASSYETGTSTYEDISDSTSSRSESASNATIIDGASPRMPMPSNSTAFDNTTTNLSINSPISGEDLRKAALRSRSRISKTQVVLVVGPPGIGKSSMILANQAKWRSHGLWGQAKFQSADSAPFAALLGCLSSVLRQLMVFHTDLQRFVNNLKERLGPQIYNIPLLYQGTPELRDVLFHSNILLDTPKERLSTRELRARFQSLVEHVFSVIAETRLFALFLDDLHEADESTLDLVSTLVNSRSRMLIFITLRSDKTEVVRRVREMFSAKARPTWINVEPLSYSAISTLVSKTMHRTKDECAPLSSFITAASSGNAFSVRNILMTLQRQRHIAFDWERNHWVYDMRAIEESMVNQKISDPTDLTFLRQHMRELPGEAKKYLTWAVFFGETFKVTEVALMMDWEDHSGSSSEDEADHKWNLHKAVSHLRDTGLNVTRSSMRGLQLALSEGWLIQRARDMCSFAHDRYRQAAQAEAECLPLDTTAKMSLRIILMMLHEAPIDVYRVAEHAKRCLPLLHEHAQRDELLDVLIDAGESAWARGAHELAIRSFTSARTLFRRNPWVEDPVRVFNVLDRLASLYQWKGNLDASDKIVLECLGHIDDVEVKCVILRIRSRNYWLRGCFHEAFNDTLLALKILGVELNATPTRRETDVMFEQVKNEILSIGFDEILSIPRSSDPKTELAVMLLNDAGSSINAYWSPAPLALTDMVGLTCIQLALRYGMSAGTALGFFWALPAAAQRRGLYRFATDLGRLALQIADKYGSMADKCRAQVLFCALASGFDQTHLRSNIIRLEEAVRYGDTAGDRLYTSLASIHNVCIRLYVCEHLSDLIVSAEEVATDVNVWLPQGESGVLNCVRVYGGYNKSNNPTTLFNVDGFTESAFVDQIHEKSGNVTLAMNWYNSFKVASFFCVGHIEEAASLGFSIYQTRDIHPNHRHTRYALFFHSLALIACIRRGISREHRSQYLKQIEANQKFLKRLAMENEWLMEEGWGLFLQGAHYSRCGIEGLGQELQRRGIARQAQWGARGIVNYMTSIVGGAEQSLKKSLFTADIGVQTETQTGGIVEFSQAEAGKIESHEDQESSLCASDLASILKWSKDISSDINLSSALQRLTEIATETSGSQNTCVVIAREAGDYTVATSMKPPDICQVHEHPRSIRTISDPLQKAIIQHAINTKEKIHYDDASSDPRFSAEAGQTAHKSVLCLPIFSNRGQTFGAVYFASKYPFSKNTVTILTLLCQQASISIANALLFRSVQAGTRENLKMIATQRDALEDARRSREDALKATKIKSNFLASMSHELRTPFRHAPTTGPCRHCSDSIHSSFYGLLDLLSGTELNPGQSEIVQTAKQSCELLLKIIDSILDYSKLEASAVKLEPSGFLVENIIADCMELLLPMAAKKLDLSFNIEPSVPEWVYADYARIRQVLMNLIGNAVKFTANGYVRVNCSVEPVHDSPGNTTLLKFDIFDTGIGLSSTDVELLFVPFQQADNSSTRRFGGTGLGLSISRQLVKLMGGAIGVYSELNVGSQFWFNIPVKLYTSDETHKAITELQHLKTSLNRRRPIELLVYSPSEATISFLNTVLNGFHVFSTTIRSAIKDQLQQRAATGTSLDFIILDDQTEGGSERLVQELESVPGGMFGNTKIIHLYTPTISRTGQPVFPTSKHSRIFKLTKPPRKSRVLQVLAELKNLPSKISTGPVSDLAKAIEDVSAAHRTLYGSVLIAEDNPIAQNLLVKQLERHNLRVVATSNGEEAIAEWESHAPGYFSIALFDHHMPVCDGVEAAKRLRVLERKRKVSVLLPIVALSADCQEATKQLCLSAGMNAFFSKPLKKDDLLTVLSTFGQPPGSS
ncbi:dual-domain HisK/Mak2 protein kinase [Macrolepiota fuliginosa MF-IS2]|uniref:Dual-domain HisK/Mak2 protein kinase n=1 Tax=Macrolepiota fuliginosa MF-IS2 TaxID=1400762 RepID=A0A9P6CAG0_9AGAR|nr:dual-domain HisK/Mak2 protein kinase [Macrolepiota fuliginosa MF-IS2]